MIVYNYDGFKLPDEPIVYIVINGIGYEYVDEIKRQCIVNNQKCDVIYVICDRIVTKLDNDVLESIASIVKGGE